MEHGMLLELLLCIVGILGICGLIASAVLSLRMASRLADFVMAEQNAAAHKVATSQRVRPDPESELKAIEEKRLSDDYSDIFMRGVATDEDIKRFGLAEGIIQ